MPQTSPMNWMAISLTMITLTNFMLTNNLMNSMSNSTSAQKKVKKMNKWTW